MAKPRKTLKQSKVKKKRLLKINSTKLMGEKAIGDGPAPGRIKAQRQKRHHHQNQRQPKAQRQIDRLAGEMVIILEIDSQEGGKDQGDKNDDPIGDNCFAAHLIGIL